MLARQGIVARIAYRTRQFWLTMSAAPLSGEARCEVGKVLSDEQMALFESQSKAGMQHGYRVMRLLVEAGHEEDDLLVAALLHDAGTYRVEYTWLDRVKVVLGQRLAPALAKKWAEGPPSGWSRAFVVKAEHARWGAESLAGAGGSAMSVSLVRRHQEARSGNRSERLEDQLLAALQWADDQS